MTKKQKLTYKAAGVDIDLADSLIKQLMPAIRSTDRAEVVGGVGGFAGLFRLPGRDMKDPMLVAATDGVGTKLLVARAAAKHDTVGVDLVAMCVNDLVCCGAEPLLFLDYFATGGIESEVYSDVLAGIIRGCKESGCALLGGETAEMPDVYARGDYDLAGFALGVVDGAKLIDGRRIQPGNVVLGLASSGLHSNGFSLARKVFSEEELAGEWGRKLLAPTRIYVAPLRALIRSVDVLGLAHITGGGFYDNIPRCLPEGVSVLVNRGTWQVPEIFGEIQQRGNVDTAEMFRTFNMGIGMVAVVSEGQVDKALEVLQQEKTPAFVLGEITKGDGSVVL